MQAQQLCTPALTAADDVDFSDPVWDEGEGVTLPPGRTVVIGSDLSPGGPLPELSASAARLPTGWLT